MEGCNGIGKHIAHRLVHDGEIVFDVPAKLSAQVRVFAAGNGRKTDPVDAHSVALVACALRAWSRSGLEEDLVVMGMLADRRDELGQARTQRSTGCTGCCWNCSPAGRSNSCPPAGRALIATIKPRDLAGKTRRRLAVELIGELGAIDRKIKALEKSSPSWSPPAGRP